MKTLTALAFTAALILPAAAEEARIAGFMKDYLAKKSIPGCAVLVRDRGEIALCAGYGVANVEHSVPVTRQTLFQSGSIGKQFTAMAILILVEEGKLALDDPVSRHLDVPKSWEAVTVRHLLTHTSGLGDYPESFDVQRDHTEDELLEMIKAQPLGFAPGDEWNYSNLGYVVLGILIHRVSGKSYEEFLRERIFEPLGMKGARVISEEEIIPHRAAGYRLKNGRLLNQEWVAPSVNTTGDGSLYLSVNDLARWFEALDNKKLISPALYEEMWTPARLADGETADYGFGWGIEETDSGKRVLQHGGAWQGFIGMIQRYPDDGLSVAVFCNRAGAGAGYIAQTIAGFYRPKLAPPRRTASKLAPEKLQRYAGKYRLEDRFTIEIRAADQRLETTWLGEKVIMVPESETSFFEEGSMRTFRFEVDAAGKVSAFIISVPEELTLQRVP